MDNKKIYGVPLVVARKVEKIVAENNILVISEVLARMDNRMQQAEWREFYGVNEDWHKHHKISNQYSRGCGCLYCQVVQRYVATKISAHRLRKRIDDDYYVLRPTIDTAPLEHLKLLENEWPELRKRKELMRISAGL